MQSLLASASQNHIVASVTTAALMYVSYEARNLVWAAVKYVIQLLLVSVSVEVTSSRRLHFTKGLVDCLKAPRVFCMSSSANELSRVPANGYFGFWAQEKFLGFVHVPECTDKELGDPVVNALTGIATAPMYFDAHANAYNETSSVFHFYIFAWRIRDFQAHVAVNVRKEPVAVLKVDALQKENNILVQFITAQGMCNEACAVKMYQLSGNPSQRLTLDAGPGLTDKRATATYAITFPNGLRAHACLKPDPHNPRSNIVFLAGSDASSKTLTQAVDHLFQKETDLVGGLHLRVAAIPLTTLRFNDGWRYDHPSLGRPISSVSVKAEYKSQLVEDIATFLGTKQWYLEHFVPYRRGYLLYGPPGTGKTSLVKALATHFSKALAIVNASSLKSDEVLTSCFATVPSDTFLLLEDIDVLVQKDVTLSTVLNALDGVTANQRGRVIFGTTNNMEAMSEATIRHGRFDQKYFIGYPDRLEIETMIKTFFSDVRREDVRRFLGNMKEAVGRVSAARIQEHFIAHRVLRDAVDCAGEIRDVPEKL